jgi:hypothetical protein
MQFILAVMVSVHILLRRDMARSLRHGASLCLSFVETMSEPTYIDGSRGHGLDVAVAYSSNSPSVYCEAGRRRRRGRGRRRRRRIQHFAVHPERACGCCVRGEWCACSESTATFGWCRRDKAIPYRTTRHRTDRQIANDDALPETVRSEAGFRRNKPPLNVPT